MKPVLIGAALSLLSLPLMANQFDQLHQIEQQTRQAEALAETERLRAAAAAQARAEAKAEASRRERASAQQAAQAKAAAARQLEAQEQQRVRTREERFEDELRAMEIEERRLELQAKRAKAARANDYIDAELRDSAARTDVIQSSADATRNVTSGTKALLEDAGAAEVNRSKRLFE